MNEKATTTTNITTKTISKIINEKSLGFSFSLWLSTLLTHEFSFIQLGFVVVLMLIFYQQILFEGWKMLNMQCQSHSWKSSPLFVCVASFIHINPGNSWIKIKSWIYILDSFYEVACIHVIYNTFLCTSEWTELSIKFQHTQNIWPKLGGNANASSVWVIHKKKHEKK